MQASLELFELDCNRLEALPPAVEELTGSSVATDIEGTISSYPLSPRAFVQH